MNRLVPADELPNAFFDPDRGPVPELVLGAAQVRRREPYVSRLVVVSLDPHLTAQSPPDQRDQSVEPYARPAADVDRLGEPCRPRLGGPFHGGEDAVHAIRNIGIVALARPIPVHPDRLSSGDEVGEAMDREVRPLARPVHSEEPRSEEHTSELQSPCNLVCRLLLEKKKKKKIILVDRKRKQQRSKYIYIATEIIFKTINVHIELVTNDYID